jgi:protoporphyrinogen IX oxidase
MAWALGPAGWSADCEPAQPERTSAAVQILLRRETMTLVLSLHIVFLALWSATLVLMPILFARQAAAADLQVRREVMLMQRWLYAMIMTPSAVLAVLFGTALIFILGFEGGWLHVKLGFVLLMGLLHVYCGTLMVKLKKPGAAHGVAYYRAMSFAATLLVLTIIGLVTYKPF